MSESIWFDGPVADAVARVNEGSHILAVFLHGKFKKGRKITDADRAMQMIREALKPSSRSY